MFRNLTIEIVTIKDIRQRARSTRRANPSLKLKSQLDTTIQVGIELIEMEWNYKASFDTNDILSIIVNLAQSLSIIFTSTILGLSTEDSLCNKRLFPKGFLHIITYSCPIVILAATLGFYSF